MKIKNPREKFLTLALIAVTVLLMYLFGITCPFKFVFKLPCAGCGMTRAYISLLHLDLRQAFEFHPMFWSVPILGLFYLFDGKLFRYKSLNTVLFSAILAGFFINWIINLVLIFN